MFKGINASPGISFGKVLVINHDELRIIKREITNIDEETYKFSMALEASRVELIKVRDRALIDFGEDKAKIFATYLLILEDPEFIDSIIDKIKTEKVNAEYALFEVRDMFIEILSTMDEYMKERAADIKDVSGRIARNILGIKHIDLSCLQDEVILVAHDLTPSETAVMNKDKVLGFLTEVGGKTSHSAIMARSLSIPAIVGLEGITKQFKDGDYVILNGDTGEVILNPSEEIIQQYKALREAYTMQKKELEAYIGRETITLDGRRIELVGNIGSPKDVEALLNSDAEGVGLYRTEFLYMQGDNAPTEDQQFKAYKVVLEAVNPKPVIIRTLDIGGDKELPYMKITPESNPFLGYRAIRLCLDQKDIFKTQLRALLRASIYGNLKIMFPMISSLQELLDAKAILAEVQNELHDENINYAKDFGIGMMIEVPSAAIISDILINHVDFFSIGTNDLIQYTCAVDRMNEKISHLYDPMHPAVIRLIKLVIDNAHKHGKWVGMCGEAAADEKMIPLLLGLGLDEFSMSTGSILASRKLICSLTYTDAQKITAEFLNF